MDRPLLIKICPTCGATEGFGRNKARKDGSNMWNRPREVVLVELAKTELTCACCHRLMTEDRRAQEAA